MDKKLSYAVIGITIAFLVAATVAASPWISSNTPLYTYRMEQASSEMDFLPTEKNDFTYTTEGGYNLNYDVLGCCDDQNPLIQTWQYTCEFYETCDTCSTCSTCSTCPATCPNTCQNTCPYTCWNTCPVTCRNTCETCAPCIP